MSTSINISSLSQASNAATSLSNLVRVTPNQNQGIQNQNGPIVNKLNTNVTIPQPNGLTGALYKPSTILFNFVGEEVIDLESDITDHYTENNSPLNDNIALRPEIFRTSGFIGELNDIFPLGTTAVQIIQSKLQAISAYAPSLSATALVVINEAILAYEIANSLVASVQSLINTTQTTINGVNVQVQTQQQVYFMRFYQYWLNRTLFTVQTPWAIFNNMVIKNLRAIQDRETQMITDFEITFKRFYVLNGTLNVNLAQGQLVAQSSSTQGQGINQLNTSSTSFNPAGFTA